MRWRRTANGMTRRGVCGICGLYEMGDRLRPHGPCPIPHLPYCNRQSMSRLPKAGAFQEPRTLAPTLQAARRAVRGARVTARRPRTTMDGSWSSGRTPTRSSSPVCARSGAAWLTLHRSPAPDRSRHALRSRSVRPPGGVRHHEPSQQPADGRVLVRVSRPARGAHRSSAVGRRVTRPTS